MSIATVLWLVAVSGLVTGAAVAAAAAVRHLHRPERGVWIAALIVTMALPFLPAPAYVAEPGAGAAVRSITQVVVVAGSSLPLPARQSTRWIPLLWGIASLATLGTLLGGAWSLSRRCETWPRRRVDGDLLRISKSFGPAVVGWVDPEIVMPAWALGLGRPQRRLIVRHENEHRWARDPQLLALGVICLAAIPWNPLAWLQFRGLRRAIEFDCDARVLRAGASPRAYGRVLLSVQLDRGRGALFAPALREPASFLERRLKTMKLKNRPVARIRVAGLALTAAALAVVACETPRPFEPEVPAEGSASSAAMSVGGAESASAGVIHEVVDPSGGEVASRSYFAAAESFVECVVEAPGEAATDVNRVDRCRQIDEAPRGGTSAPSPEGTIVEAKAIFTESSTARPAGGTAPLIIVDGVRMDATGDDDPLGRLSPSDIDRIEVVEEAAATAEYGSGASDGAIRIFTRKGGS